MTTRLKKHNCPMCDHILDAATALSGEDVSPEPEDITICISCAEVLQFDEKLDLIKMDNKVLDTIPYDTLCQIVEIQKHIMKRTTH